MVALLLVYPHSNHFSFWLLGIDKWLHVIFTKNVQRYIFGFPWQQRFFLYPRPHFYNDHIVHVFHFHNVHYVKNAFNFHWVLGVQILVSF